MYKYCFERSRKLLARNKIRIMPTMFANVGKKKIIVMIIKRLSLYWFIINCLLSLLLRVIKTLAIGRICQESARKYAILHFRRPTLQLFLSVFRIRFSDIFLQQSYVLHVTIYSQGEEKKRKEPLPSLRAPFTMFVGTNRGQKRGKNLIIIFLTEQRNEIVVTWHSKDF